MTGMCVKNMHYTFALHVYLVKNHIIIWLNISSYSIVFDTEVGHEKYSLILYLRNILLTVLPLPFTAYDQKNTFLDEIKFALQVFITANHAQYVSEPAIYPFTASNTSDSPISHDQM